jgi:ferredoxin
MGMIKVDRTRCQGHGRCYAVAPGLFRPIDDDGHTEFTGDFPEAGPERTELGEKAIRSCPELALSWASTSEDHPPEQA